MGRQGKDACWVGAEKEEEPCVTALSWEGYDGSAGLDGWWGRAGEEAGTRGGGWVGGGKEEEEDGGSEGSEEGSGDMEGWGGGW